MIIFHCLILQNEVCLCRKTALLQKKRICAKERFAICAADSAQAVRPAKYYFTLGANRNEKPEYIRDEQCYKQFAVQFCKKRLGMLCDNRRFIAKVFGKRHLFSSF